MKGGSLRALATKIPDIDTAIPTTGCDDVVIGSRLKLDFLDGRGVPRQTKDWSLCWHVNDPRGLIPGGCSQEFVIGRELEIHDRIHVGLESQVRVRKAMFVVSG